MNELKRKANQSHLKKEMDETIKTSAQTNGQSLNNQRNSLQQQAVYATHFDAGPLTYLRVVDAKTNHTPHNIQNNNNHQSHQLPKHYNNNNSNINQHQFTFATSSLQDGEGSPYFSDSTLSNCDRDAADACPSRPSGSRLAQDTTNNNRSSTNHPNRCNSANGAGQPPRGVRKRVMANERERERTKSLNQALEILRSRLPVSEAEKRSKIQTLRMARDYIEFLAQDHQLLLNSNVACNEQGQYDNKPMTFDRCLQQQQQHQPAAGPGANKNQLDSITYKFYKFRLKSHSRRE